MKIAFFKLLAALAATVAVVTAAFGIVRIGNPTSVESLGFTALIPVEYQVVEPTIPPPGPIGPPVPVLLRSATLPRMEIRSLRQALPRPPEVGYAELLARRYPGVAFTPVPGTVDPEVNRCVQRSVAELDGRLAGFAIWNDTDGVVFHAPLTSEAAEILHFILASVAVPEGICR